MNASNYSAPSNEIIANRLKWLTLAFEEFRVGGASAYLSKSPPVELLTSGLRHEDQTRWNIGLLDAEPVLDASDGSSSVILTYGKPAERRESGEADWTKRQFDPPAVLLQQLHILCGGRLRLRTSRSHTSTSEHPKGVPYHYPLIGIPTGPSKRFEFRTLRAILNAPSDRLANAYEEFRDLRRRNLDQPWLTQKQASVIFGSQKGGRYHTRKDAVEASLQAFDQRHSAPRTPLSREEFRRALVQTYELLDCHPLRPSTLP